jgi:hypothetical protein
LLPPVNASLLHTKKFESLGVFLEPHFVGLIGTTRFEPHVQRMLFFSERRPSEIDVYQARVYGVLRHLWKSRGRDRDSRRCTKAVQTNAPPASPLPSVQCRGDGFSRTCLRPGATRQKGIVAMARDPTRNWLCGTTVSRYRSAVLQYAPLNAVHIARV